MQGRRQTAAVRAALVPVALSFMAAACGTSKKTKPLPAATAVASATSTATGTDVKVVHTTAGRGLDTPSLALGPYLVDALGSVPDAQFSLEYGYIDIHQIKSKTKDDVFDYRWKQASAIAATKYLPTAPAIGCTDVSGQKASVTATAGSAVSFTGATTGAPASSTDGIFRIEVKDAKTDFDVSKSLTATFSGGPAATLNSPKLPTAGTIQIAGAFDGNLSTALNVGDMSRAMAKTTSDLLMADIQNGKDYNLIIITYYGGVGAETDALRCVLLKGGTATLPSTVYKGLLPLRAITGVFANVQVTSEPSSTSWTAAITGQGVEDLSGP